MKANNAMIDLAVIGAGIKGCLTALRAAQSGLNVVLVEKRQFPGQEITAGGHTFIRTEGEERFNRLCPTWLQRIFSLRNEQEAMAPEGLTKQWLMDALEQHGAAVLYCAEAAGITHAQAGTTGVLLATPFGPMHLAARKVADATERLNLGRLISGIPYVSGRVVVRGVFEMENVKGDAAGLSSVESRLSLVKGSLRVHPTLRNDTKAVEFAYEDEASGICAARSVLETRRIAKAEAIAACLRQSIPEFAEASLSFHANDAYFEGDDTRFPSDAAAFPSIEGLRSLSPLQWGFSLNDLADAWEEAGRLAQWAAEATEAVGATDGAAAEATGASPERQGTAQLVMNGEELAWSQEDLTPYADEGMPVCLSLVSAERLAARAKPPVFQADICIAGGGAGGSMAVVSASRSGKSVAVIESNTLLGGTHTVGLVTGYYDGYRGGMNQKIADEAQAFAQPTGLWKSGGGLPHASYLNHHLQEPGVRYFGASLVCGTLKEDGRVKGVLAANEDGLFLVEAHVTIDATGNADVAAFAGAAYELGDPETGMVQSYSVWGTDVLPTGSFLSNRYLNDQGICHPDLYSERLRAIREGHLDNSPFHISPMVTVRESRRIKGEDELTIRNILDDRLYDNVVAVACTRADSHAYTSSPLARIGGLGAGKEVQVRIPYGCFIPKGIEGLLVAAKALSGERDATSFCRMNADIKNAGYAMGLAAAMAVDQGSGVRDIDLPKLQGRLKELGILPEWTFRGQERTDTAKLAGQAAESDLDALTALLRRPREAALPVLEALYQEGKRGLAVHALAWFGSASGAVELEEELAQAIDQGRHRSLPMLNAFRASIRWGRDYGDDFTLVNRLIMFAGRSGDSRLAVPLARLIADTEGFGPLHPGIMPYDIRRDDIVRYPFYNRLLNIAYAAAERADQCLVPALETLLSRDGVTGYAVEQGSTARPRFMLAHAEVRLARAAVRCGSTLGREIMASYLNDKHSFFRETARRELEQAGKAAVLSF
ncbi:MAG: hypothetical protein K0R57_1297 [Paenibacillaceae bacterium]|nr:hypothetical protein [Paenibacillaceae bacterium]